MLYGRRHDAQALTAWSEARDFDAVWLRVEQHAGQDFYTNRGISFVYQVPGNYVRPSTNLVLSRTNSQKALAQLPTDGPGALPKRQGPSYTWAILMDERVRGSDWT